MSETNLFHRYLPWQTAQINRVQQQLGASRLPHALLLSGIADIGKKDFAHALTGQLLCDAPGDDGACGHCPRCLLVNAGTHPDMRVICPEDSKLIRIDQIRGLIDWANQTAQQGGNKVAVIFPAEQMNIQSANALLKCLEEPPANTFFILVSDQPGRLLPTIRSRCQNIEFPVPPREDALNWLKKHQLTTQDAEVLLALASGAPIKALNSFDGDYMARRERVVTALEKLLLGSAAAVAITPTLLNKENPAEVYDILYSVFADSLKYRLTSDENTLINKDIQSIINVLDNNISQPDLIRCSDSIAASRRSATGSSNANQQMLLESLLIKITGQAN